MRTRGKAFTLHLVLLYVFARWLHIQVWGVVWFICFLGLTRASSTIGFDSTLSF